MKFFATFLLCALAVCAQTNHGVQGSLGVPSVPVTGADSGFKVSPDGTVLFKSCLTVTIGNLVQPVIGATLHIESGTVASSGYHEHENDPYAQIYSSIRPGPKAVHAYAGDWTLDANGYVQVVTSDQFGCAYVTYNLPGPAGWFSYTTSAEPFMFTATDGMPEYLTAVSNTLNFEARWPVNGPPFVPYGFSAVNPLSLYWPTIQKDPFHGLGFTLFLNQAISDAVYAASQGYASLTSSQYNGNVDYAQVWRGSLGNGGLADNYYSSLQADETPTGDFYPAYPGTPWVDVQNEEHFWGNEVDVMNPAYHFSSTNKMQNQILRNLYFALMVSQFSAQGCNLGQNQTGTGPGASAEFASQGWWKLYDNLHFTCAYSPLPQSSQR